MPRLLVFRLQHGIVSLTACSERIVGWESCYRICEEILYVDNAYFHELEENSTENRDNFSLDTTCNINFNTNLNYVEITQLKLLLWY